MSTSVRLTLALDSVAIAPAMLELSAALARGRRFELHAVFIESSAALRAAALPFARALAGTAWEPIDPDRVQRLLRADAERVRTQLAAFAARLDMAWSFDVVRGRFPHAALQVPGAELTLLGAASFTGVPAPARARTVAVIAAPDAQGARARAVAQDLAEALGARLECLPAVAAAQSAVRLPGGTLALVVPRATYAKMEGARLRCPILLVNEDERSEP